MSRVLVSVPRGQTICDPEVQVDRLQRTITGQPYSKAELARMEAERAARMAQMQQQQGAPPQTGRVPQQFPGSQQLLPLRIS
ncbi:MAG: hypothetical protein GT598_07945 [Bacteroidales bacterium]|nr:hypothetical protein [Bacteroidales bacterium]